MSAATAFAGRLGLSAWRRRGTWLGLVLLMMVLLVCLQFYSEPSSQYLKLLDLMQHKKTAQNQVLTNFDSLKIGLFFPGK
jgi:hypothetical protein